MTSQARDRSEAAASPAAITPAPVLILGAGVNGLCVARELALNGVPVVVVDIADLGGGASAKSSRLIHGGLRYLEYGEFRLVRESLEERERLLELAPHLVRPLQLHIPVRRRRGGLLHAAVRFIGLGRIGWIQRLLARLRIPAERGLWAARIGLWLYDGIARHGRLPGHTVTKLQFPGGPPLDTERYRWVCSYWDAQMDAPERFCVALWRDAQRAAKDRGVACELLTYHRARLTADGVEIQPVDGFDAPQSVRRAFRPAMIVNATGAWGDFTLAALPVNVPRLFGGTRGSHLVTRQPRLVSAIGRNAIYAEAPDGRLVFILPWSGAVLVGTTDVRFEGPPEAAVTTPDELAYLVQMVNFVLPTIGLTTEDVDCCYSGVRPLPYAPAGRTAAISRDHAIDTRQTANGLRIATLVGGKLTTCRTFGAEAADRVLQYIGRARRADTLTRPLPGGVQFPVDAAAEAAEIERLRVVHRLTPASAAACWRLFGTETEAVLSEAFATTSAAPDPDLTLPIASFPLAVIDWIVRNEMVRTVADLIERRLLLAFESQVSPAALELLEERIRRQLGSCPRGAEDAAVRLQRYYRPPTN